MKAHRALLLITALFMTMAWTGCSSLHSDDQPAGPADAQVKSKEDSAAKGKALERKLAIAKARLRHAKMEQDSRMVELKKSLEYAQKEFDLAQAKLDRFQAFDAPNRIARAELSLKSARDAAEEAEEELKQLEIMYKEQDLEDLTAEFVINRGKRNAERRKQSLLIQERALKSLTNHEIPTEKKSLELEVEKKKDALGKTKRSAEAGLLKDEIEIMRIDSEIADLQEDLEDLKKKEG
jgi:hypothetical protein